MIPPRRRAEDVPEAQWIEFLNRPYQVKCGSYGEIHSKWLSRVPADQFFVGDFSRVATDPLGLLRDVCGFVGVEFDERYFAARARLRVNPTASSPIPARIREELERLHVVRSEEFTRSWQHCWRPCWWSARRWSRSLPPRSSSLDGGIKKSTVTVPEPVIAQR